MAEASALHILAKQGDVKTLTQALKSADPNAGDNDGMRPLHYAAWYGHVGCIQALLSGGADIDAHDFDGATALHAAAYNGQAASVLCLVEARADTTITDNDNCTPSQVAGNENHVEVMNYLRVVGMQSAVLISINLFQAFWFVMKSHKL
eukprot:m.110415 g.110415  ORF g.110415 m.110415 type:complete len:149 (-) comp13403_c0_seq1:3162-3608(-)